MKTIKLKSLILLFAVVGIGVNMLSCSKEEVEDKTDKKSSEEPTVLQPAETGYLTEDLILSYLPYKENDKLGFNNENFHDYYYTVKRINKSTEDGMFTYTISMTGTDFDNYNKDFPYFIDIEITCLNQKELDIHWLHETIFGSYVFTKEATYHFNATGSNELPESIHFTSDEGVELAVINKGSGIESYIDFDNVKCMYDSRIRF